MFGMLEAAGGVLRGGTVVCGLLAAVADLEVEEEVMSDKKYVVPEEGLKAALDSAGQTLSGCPWQELATKAVEAFIRWQSENPIAPTDALLEEILQLAFFGGADWTDPQVFKFCTEWQRRMYLAPEPEVRPFVRNVIQGFQGCTLTPHEADKIVEELVYVTHGWRMKETE